MRSSSMPHRPATTKGKGLERHGLLHRILSPERGRHRPPPPPILPEVDAEKLTSEEEMSRMLHNPKPQVKLPSKGHLYEHFVVVGVDDPSQSISPKILFSYPPNVPANYPGLEDFCFPEGTRSERLALTWCHSEILEMTHSQSYLHRPENLFVFLFTANQSDLYYGVCAHRRELFQEPPSYIDRNSMSLEAQATTMRCYCLISRFPFFRLHIDFLLNLSSVDRLHRLEQEPPTIEDAEELSVFLGTKEKQFTPLRTSGRWSESADRVNATGLASPIDMGAMMDFEESETSSDIPEMVQSTNSLPIPEITVFEPAVSPKNLTTPSPLRKVNNSRRSVSKDLANDCSPSVLPPRRRSLSLDGSDQVKDLSRGYEDEHASPNRGNKSRKRSVSHFSPSDKLKMPVASADLNPCVDALQRYYDSSLPRKGQEFSFPVSQYLNPITFHRPFFDEEEELYAEWALPLAFYKLNFKGMLTLLSGVLLERRIVVVSENLRYLSAVVLSIPPLIRPFVYQSVIIPMLPLKMPHLLEAPVPYVVGMTRITQDMSLPDDVIVFNLDQGTINTPNNLPLLPRAKQLQDKCQEYLSALQSSYKKEIPFSTTPEQLNMVWSISTVFEAHLGSLFANFNNYTISNMNNPAKPITVFMKDSFLEDLPRVEREFIEPFLTTQAFFSFSDAKLRKRDSSRVILEVLNV